MRFDHHHHFDFEVELVERLFKTLFAINLQLGEIMSGIQNLQLAVAALVASAQASNAAIESAVKGLDTIKGQLDDAIAAGADGAALQQLSDQIGAQVVLINSHTASLTEALAKDVTGAPATETPAAATDPATGTGTGTTDPATTAPAA